MSTSTVPDRDVPDLPTPEPTSARLIVAALCFGGLSAALMQTLVIPIQVTLPALLHADASSTSWVVTATLLGGAVAMPVAGRLADLYGKQRVLLASALILVLGSAICALSGSVGPMIIGRALQGIAMGYIPVAISLVREVTPPHMTSTAIAALSATLGVGAAIGLPLSAWIAQSWDWHMLFWVSVVLAGVVAALTVVVVPHIHDAHPGRLDLVGALGLAVGLVALLVGVSKGRDWGWGSATTWGCILGGLAVLALWAAYELRQRDPLVDLKVTARKPILLTNVAAILIGFGMMAQSIVMPQLLEMPRVTGYGLGQTLLQAGLWMAPGGLMMMLFAPVSSYLMKTQGPRTTLSIGAFTLAVGYAVAMVMMDAPWKLLIALCVGSAGIGIGYAAMPSLILQNVPPAESASAVGVNTLMRSVGTTVAGAVMVTLMMSQTMRMGAHDVPTQGAFRLCFVVGAAAAHVGALVPLLLPANKPRDPHVHARDIF